MRAGAQAQALPAGDVTYVAGPSATVVIVQAGDRPDGSAVQNLEELTLHEPFPEGIEARLASSELPLLGFVRLPQGYMPLGELRLAVSHHRPGDMAEDSPFQGFGGGGHLRWCEAHTAHKTLSNVVNQPPTLAARGGVWAGVGRAESQNRRGSSVSGCG